MSILSFFVFLIILIIVGYLLNKILVLSGLPADVVRILRLLLAAIAVILLVALAFGYVTLPTFRL